MGVPALFRWLSTKYPKITSPVQEELPVEINGELVPVDTSKPNPNLVEFDNLYLDMNGIVHPCTHPEDRPPPATEDEAMILIFEYIDRIFGMIRPRKVLYMAIDGVAPRAKMNQQRSRRFRASLEAQQKEEDDQRTRDELIASGLAVPEKSDSPRFDSNCITPGTPFMFRLSECLQYYITDRLNRDPGWANVKVILSDGSVPGEGEHKIMDYIRRQRLHPKYNPNTTHVIYGLDADLIMLALATHEPHFWVLREDVFANDGKSSKCFVCNQVGHLASQCTGAVSASVAEEADKEPTPRKPFVFLNVSILREYLEFEMRVQDLSFPWDVERAFDDWVFLCFFVGNDFLPHLPSLEIREGAIDTLIDIYKRNLNKQRGYLTENGNVNLEFAQKIMEDLGQQEDEIFRKRREGEERRKEGAARRKREREDEATVEALTTGLPSDRIEDMSLFAVSVKDAKKYQSTNKVFASAGKAMRSQNMSAAQALKALLANETEETKPAEDAPEVAEKDQDLAEEVAEQEQDVADAGKLIEQSEVAELTETPTEPEASPHKIKRKRKVKEEPLVDNEAIFVAETPVIEEVPIPVKTKPAAAEEDEEPYDEVRLWETGWRERYYETKFGDEPKMDPNFRKKLVHAYVEGLCWVLKYYFQGCASWQWFYPYHYSPFASDFVDTDLSTEMVVKFTLGKPFRPFEQLMGVLPAGSKSHIPEAFRSLMTEESSEILDFYPEKFLIDLNGKKYAWQGVALLPFIEEKRLLKAMDSKYALLDEDTLQRNTEGKPLLFVSGLNALFEMLCDLYSTKFVGKPVTLEMNLSGRMSGQVLPYPEACIPGSTYYSPLTEFGLEDISSNNSICAIYIDPQPPRPDFEYPACLLPGLKLSEKVLAYQDFLDSQNSGRNKRGRNSYGTGPRYDQGQTGRPRESSGSSYNSRGRDRHDSRDSGGRYSSGDSRRQSDSRSFHPYSRGDSSRDVGRNDRRDSYGDQRRDSRQSSSSSYDYPQSRRYNQAPPPQQQYYQQQPYPQQPQQVYYPQAPYPPALGFQPRAQTQGFASRPPAQQQYQPYPPVQQQQNYYAAYQQPAPTYYGQPAPIPMPQQPFGVGYAAPAAQQLPPPKSKPFVPPNYSFNPRK